MNTVVIAGAVLVGAAIIGIVWLAKVKSDERTARARLLAEERRVTAQENAKVERANWVRLLAQREDEANLLRIRAIVYERELARCKKLMKSAGLDGHEVRHDF